MNCHSVSHCLTLSNINAYVNPIESGRRFRPTVTSPPCLIPPGVAPLAPPLDPSSKWSQKEVYFAQIWPHLHLKNQVIYRSSCYLWRVKSLKVIPKYCRGIKPERKCTKKKKKRKWAKKRKSYTVFPSKRKGLWLWSLFEEVKPLKLFCSSTHDAEKYNLFLAKITPEKKRTFCWVPLSVHLWRLIPTVNALNLIADP